jgi:hypothetical protein
MATARPATIECDGEVGCARPVAAHCAACGGNLCEQCDKIMHTTKATRKHVRTPVVACDGEEGCMWPAAVTCAQCGGHLCLDCDNSMHKAKSTSKHSRVPLTSVRPGMSPVRLLNSYTCEVCAVCVRESFSCEALDFEVFGFLVFFTKTIYARRAAVYFLGSAGGCIVDDSVNVESRR